MKRLTKKDEKGHYFPTVESAVFDEEQQCIDKLGEIEDIEEELGIDLETLFKVSDNGAYLKVTMKHYHASVDLKHRIIRFSTHQGEEYGVCYCPIKSYGKMYALTKEELL